MPNSSNPISALGGLLAVEAGLLGLAVGLRGTFATEDLGPMRLVFFLLGVGGAASIYAGVAQIRKWRRDTAREKQHQVDMRAAVGLPPYPKPQPPPLPGMAPRPAAPAEPRPMIARPAPVAEARAKAVLAGRTVEEVSSGAAQAPAVPAMLSDGELVLAHWTYAADEWGTYTGSEWRYRAWEAVGVAVLATVLLGLLGLLEMDARSAFGLSLTIGVLLGLGRLVVADSQRNANATGPGEAIITPTAVMLNGQYHVLRNDWIRFGGVVYESWATPPVLSFTVRWKVREGVTNEQVRVPVPRGREAEAQEIIRAFAPGQDDAPRT